MRIFSWSRLAACVTATVLPAVAAAHDGFDCEGIVPVSGEGITTELVSGALNNPVEATAPLSDPERLFVVEQAGRIRIISLADDTLVATPFLDIRGRIDSGGERGLLGLAFHPEYETNGFFYVYYTRGEGATCTANPPPGCPGESRAESVVARFQVREDDPNRADPDSELILLTFCQPFGNHNAGKIAFGPLDDYLYIATGDGGSGGDPCHSGQRVDSFLGKILRIDVNAGEPYAIPPTNPFAGDADPDDEVLDEIWALGLRNPWRFGFDAFTGDLYIADVGQNLWEEIDFQPGASTGGENYGWRRWEGDHSFSSSETISVGTLTQPIIEYPHGAGVGRGYSITGGEVYRGCRMPDLHGTYFFADYENDWIQTCRVVNGEVTELRDRTGELNAGIVPNRIQNISAFGRDARGELYICDLRSKLYRIVPTSTPNNPPVAVIVTDPTPAIVALGAGPSEILLDGSQSDDGDGGLQGLSFAWEKITGPQGDEIVSPNAATTVVRFSLADEYVYRLSVDDGESSDTADVTVQVVTIPPPPPFTRGDTNGDGNLDLSDGVFTLNHLFLGSPPGVPCPDALDSDDNEDLDLTDSIYLLTHLFLGGPAPPAPYPDCGNDPTGDNTLDCNEPHCAF